VTVVVRQINSRKVYVTGQVGMSGAYPLIGPRTVLQAIAMAGWPDGIRKRGGDPDSSAGR
jgi:protein involved in polysaccharide export with SLBB domain